MKSIAVRVGLVAAAVMSLSSVAPAQSIEAGHVFPADGVVVPQGGTIAVRWKALERGASIDISLWDGAHGRWYDIARDVDASLSSVSWPLPHWLRGNLFRIRIRQSGSERVLAMSGTYFTIQPVETPSDNNSVSTSTPSIE